jgi:hypothetical protein
MYGPQTDHVKHQSFLDVDYVGKQEADSSRDIVVAEVDRAVPRAKTKSVGRAAGRKARSSAVPFVGEFFVFAACGNYTL